MQEQQNTPTEISVPPDDCRLSTDAGFRLITRRIQSDVAIAVHVPKLGLAALARFSLPNSAISPAQMNPWMCADTAIPLLFGCLRSKGLTNEDLSVYAIGGAAGAEDDFVSSGKSNVLAMQRLLWREGVLLKGEDTGGSASRSAWFDVTTGRIIVRTRACSPIAAAALEERGKLRHFAS